MITVVKLGSAVTMMVASPRGFAIYHFWSVFTKIVFPALVFVITCNCFGMDPATKHVHLFIQVHTLK